MTKFVTDPDAAAFKTSSVSAPRFESPPLTVEIVAPVPTRIIEVPPLEGLVTLGTIVGFDEAVLLLKLPAPVPKSNAQSVAFAFCTWDAAAVANNVIAAALRRKLWNAAELFFFARVDAVVFIRCR